MKKWSYFIVIIIVLILSVVTFIVLNSDSDYSSTGKYIIGYEIFDDNEKDPTCTMIKTYVLFSTDEFDYVYGSSGCSTEEFVVKVDNDYINISDFIENRNISNDDIEKSEIGYRCYECVPLD